MEPKTLEAIRAWPIENQLALVFDLWDHIVDSGWRPAPSEQLKAELSRRLAAHAADPSRVLTEERVLAHVKRPR